MSTLLDLVNRCPPEPSHRPFSRVRVDVAAWQLATECLVTGNWSLLGLWADASTVHAAILDSDAIAVLSLECPDRTFPSLGRHHPPAARLERTIRELWGLEPVGLEDERPWLDHDCWGDAGALGIGNPRGSHRPYAFLPAEGESLHEIPVGPVHAGVIEPGHFRFSANGETVVRLEARLGYVHRGIERLMGGADLTGGAELAGRCSGDSTVAYALAFARASEAALGIEAPPRAHWLRALMAELERLANHFGDVGAICNDAAFALMHTHCGILRERVLRAADACFGHRLMRDLIVPGGVKADIDAAGMQTLRTLLAEIRFRSPAIIELYDNTASLQDRTVGTGLLKPEITRQYAAGGYVGRASGRDFDARRVPGYPPYAELEFSVPVLAQGDVDARVWIRIREIEQSLTIVTQLLDGLPAGDLWTNLPQHGGEGMAVVEGFRGDVLAWLRVAEDATIERCHLRDPSWFQWPLLEAAIEGNIVADFPLCNKSFNCSYSGHDL
jgi:Ni,Fe-hydrogenase III large subunit